MDSGVCVDLLCVPSSQPPLRSLFPFPHKTLLWIRLCASAAAQYQLREVFDNLIISLSKFTTLLHPPDPSSSVALTLASELRARLSLQMLLSMCRQHGAMMREGWKNLLDCLLSLFRARLLPEEMVKVLVM